MNCYFPCTINEANLEKKCKFQRCVARRVRQLASVGRAVVIVGDTNICLDPIDVRGGLVNVRSKFGGLDIQFVF